MARGGGGRGSGWWGGGTGGGQSRFRSPSSGASCAHIQGNGILPFKQCGDRRPVCPAGIRNRKGGDYRLGRPSWKRHSGDFLRGPDGLLFFRPSIPLLSGNRKRTGERFGGRRGEHAQLPA